MPSHPTLDAILYLLQDWDIRLPHLLPFTFLIVIPYPLPNQMISDLLWYQYIFGHCQWPQTWKSQWIFISPHLILVKISAIIDTWWRSPYPFLFLLRLLFLSIPWWRLSSQTLPTNPYIQLTVTLFYWNIFDVPQIQWGYKWTHFLSYISFS